MLSSNIPSKKILIFGNSGSGKSTLAKKLQVSDGLSNLDLDTLAWQPSQPPQRTSIDESAEKIRSFIDVNLNWVIEGCYADLLQVALPNTSEIIYLNLPVKACIANAKKRPWEPHKYDSKAAQDENLDMLIEWISQYPNRSDTFSKVAHQRLYDDFIGIKKMLTENQ